MGRKPADASHPDGYGKYETAGEVLLGLSLLGTGFSVIVGASAKLVGAVAAAAASSSSSAKTIMVPGIPALFVAALSVLSKEWLYRITKQVGEELSCPILIANAWHHRSDAWSSVLALASIGLTISKLPGMILADSVAGVLVGLMISKMGYEVMEDSARQLLATTNADQTDDALALAENERM